MCPFPTVSVSMPLIPALLHLVMGRSQHPPWCLVQLIRLGGSSLKKGPLVFNSRSHSTCTVAMNFWTHIFIYTFFPACVTLANVSHVRCAVSSLMTRQSIRTCRRWRQVVLVTRLQTQNSKYWLVIIPYCIMLMPNWDYSASYNTQMCNRWRSVHLPW